MRTDGSNSEIEYVNILPVTRRASSRLWSAINW
jgi:hypothetical protein